MVIKNIVEKSKIKSTDIVLEIGPGVCLFFAFFFFLCFVFSQLTLSRNWKSYHAASSGCEESDRL